VTHNSLVASQRPHISLIDRRHFDDAALPMRFYVKQKILQIGCRRCRSPIDSVKPYQRSRFAAPYAQRSGLKASVNNALLGACTAEPTVLTLDVAHEEIWS